MFEELLERIALELGSKGIPYMIIGGQAVLLYGEPRMTKDIDVTLGVSVDQAESIIALASGMDLKPLPSDAVAFVNETFVLPTIDEASGIRVDFIFSQSSFEREAIGRARPVKVRDAEVRFASLEDLVIHKIVSGRPRDMEDVKIVLTKNQDYDREYIIKWLDEFDSALDTGFHETFDELI